MSLDEIQMLWLGGVLSNLERLSIASHLKHGHPVRLFSYQSIPNLPRGTIEEDARAILPESAIFTNPSAQGYGGLSMFSNFFRYTLLLERGGIWSDCDSIAVKPLAFAATREYFFTMEPVYVKAGEGPTARISNAVIKVPAGSAVIARALEIARAADLESAPWGSSGPLALDRAVTELGLTQFALAPEILCPVGWWQVPALVSGLSLLPANTHAVHFYNEIWRRNFLDKNADYDPLSLYERLKAEYLGPKETRHA